MAVLKSFELNGNKQSLANWISNLSPCDTPFSSMIGKAKIDGTHYSWQTDALAPPEKEIFEEGSLVLIKPREATHVLSNFTSILRKVASVSESAMAISTRGREDELKYQLTKAAKEMKRDLEFMNLGSNHFHPGSTTQASQFSSFQWLCAPTDLPDADTGAVTSKVSVYHDVNGHWFTIKKLFEVTYGLYMSGSKADKIMFHPRHVQVFSDAIGDSYESPHMYRMFDGLDDTVNLKVSKIKDPLGRVYTLIPNRFMPEDKVYIFNEEDWTQTILRTPERSELGKKGSSESHLIEMEVGLRHRHPYASGVLSLLQENIDITMTKIDDHLTIGVKSEGDATLLARDKFGGILANQAIDIVAENPRIFTVAPESGTTGTDGTFSFKVRATGLGRGAFHIRIGDKHSRSFYVLVEGPDVDSSITPNTLLIGGDTSNMLTIVDDAAGSPAVGVTVSWRCEPGNLVEFTSISKATDGTGIAETTVKGLTKGQGQIITSIDGVVYDFTNVFVGEGGKMTFTISPNPSLMGTETTFTVHVTGQDGTNIANAPITFSGDDVGLTPGTTNAFGVYEDRITPLISGEFDLFAECNGLSIASSKTFVVDEPEFNITATIDSNPMTYHDTERFFIKDSTVTFTLMRNGFPVPDTVLEFDGDVSAALSGVRATTNAQGKADLRLTPQQLGQTVITAKVKGTKKQHQLVIPIKKPKLSVIPNLATAWGGDPITLEAMLQYADGTAVTGAPAGKTVKLESKPAFVAVISDVTTTGSGGLTNKASVTLPNDLGIHRVSATYELDEDIKGTCTVEVVPADFKIHASVNHNVATQGVSQTLEISSQISASFKGVRSLKGRTITITDPNGFFQIVPSSGKTDANGLWKTSAAVIGKPGTNTSLIIQCADQIFNLPLSIKAPVVKVEVEPNPAMVGTSFAGTATVYLEDGTTPAGQDIDLEWEVTPNDIVEFQESAYKTNAAGQVAIVAVLADKVDHTFKANTGSFFSNTVVLKAGDIKAEILVDGAGDMTAGISDTRALRAVGNFEGVHQIGMGVAVTSSDTSVITIRNPATGTTDSEGEFDFIVQATNKVGTSVITATVTNPTTGHISVATHTITVSDPLIVVT
ncbi:MAG: SU10 major capsid protein, partial [Bacteroidales bacterium]